MNMAKRLPKIPSAGDCGCLSSAQLAVRQASSDVSDATPLRRASMGLPSTICVMAVSDPASGPDESLPWSLLPEPPGLGALESAIGDLDEAMQPSTPMVESVRLLESASLGICDVADRIEEYLRGAEATLALSLRGRGHDPAAAAAGATADRMLAGLRHLADASRAYAATLDDPDVDGSAAERELHTARADGFEGDPVVSPGAMGVLVGVGVSSGQRRRRG